MEFSSSTMALCVRYVLLKLKYTSEKGSTEDTPNLDTTH